MTLSSPSPSSLSFGFAFLLSSCLRFRLFTYLLYHLFFFLLSLLSWLSFASLFVISMLPFSIFSLSFFISSLDFQIGTNVVMEFLTKSSFNHFCSLTIDSNLKYRIFYTLLRLIYDYLGTQSNLLYRSSSCTFNEMPFTGPF